MKNKKPLPKFRSEAEEQEFWSTHDATEYVDWGTAWRVTLAKLKPSTKTISPRLPEHLLESLKLLANKRDIPCQSLMKSFLTERVEEELRSAGRTAR